MPRLLSSRAFATRRTKSIFGCLIVRFATCARRKRRQRCAESVQTASAQTASAAPSTRVERAKVHARSPAAARERRVAESPLRVLIVDDEAPARRRLRELLDDCAAALPLAIVGEAANGREALDLLHTVSAD